MKKIALPNESLTRTFFLPGGLGTGTGLFLPLDSSWNTALVASGACRPSDQKHTVSSPGSPACWLTLQISGLVSLHSRMSQFLIISLCNKYTNTHSLGVLFLWRTPTDPPSQRLWAPPCGFCFDQWDIRKHDTRQSWLSMWKLKLALLENKTTMYKTCAALKASWPTAPVNSQWGHLWDPADTLRKC